MVRTRRANRYCVDCGARLVYYPRLSNPKAPNEHRVLVYACPDCTDDFEKPKMFSIRRNQVEDPLETVEIEITQIQKKVALANDGLYQTAMTTGTIAPYWDIVEKIKSGNYKKGYDDSAKASYLWNAKDSIFISWETPKEIKQKAEEIYTTIDNILIRSKQEGLPSYQVANRIAEERVQAKGSLNI